MGSVPNDYVCPHCDGKGYGGYSVDGIGYPICTEGIANCVEKLGKGQHTRALVKRAALKRVLVIRYFLEEDCYQSASQQESHATHYLNIFSYLISEFL